MSFKARAIKGKNAPSNDEANHLQKIFNEKGR